MPIKVEANSSFKTELLALSALVEYSTDKLVFLNPSVLSDLRFTWISPTNRKFEERAMYRDETYDEPGLYAYSATIYPVFTAGVQGDVGKAIIGFREGVNYSPMMRISISKSVLPEQTELPVTVSEELAGAINTNIDSIIADRVRITDLESVSEGLLEEVNYNPVNGTLTFTKHDESTIDIDLPLELIIESGYYDLASKEIRLVLADGAEITIPVDALIEDHEVRIAGLEVVADGLLENATYTPSNGFLTFYKHDGSSFILDLPLELIVNTGYFDNVNDEVVLVLSNGDEIKIPVSNLLQGMATESYVDDQITARQPIIQVVAADFTEANLITYMQSVSEGIYRIKSVLWGEELLFVSTMSLPDKNVLWLDGDTITYVDYKEYARYLANGSSYTFNADLGDWELAAGGGGGDGTGTTADIRLTAVVASPLTFSAAVGQTTTITALYAHNQVTTGVVTVAWDGDDVFSQAISTGEFTVDVSDYIRSGENELTLTVSDGENTRSLTYIVTGLSIGLSSTFNDEVAYGTDVNIPFRVESDGDRKVYFTVDGVTEEIGISVVNNIKALTGLSHGVHIVEIQAAITANGVEILSPTLTLNVIVITNTTALISSKFDTTSTRQGTRLAIDYIAYDPTVETTSVTLSIDTVPVGSIVADRTKQYWNISTLDEGTHTLLISINGASKSFTIEITPLGYTFVNVEDSFLKLFLTAEGLTNSDIDKENWSNSYGAAVDAELEGFNFSSNGWVDENLVFNGNTSLEIGYKPFSSAVTTLGKTIEIEFLTTTGSALPFVECWESDKGFRIYKDRAYLKSSNTESSVFFKEDEKVKISFVISPVDGTTLIYVNGVMTGIDRMNVETIFQQTVPQNIKINQNYINGELFNVRVYERALSHEEILQNYLYDMSSLEDKITEYNFSDVFNGSGLADYDKVKVKMPVMTITTYEEDEFGNELPQTADFKPYVRVVYEHHIDAGKDFTIANVRIRTQGSSTLQYPVKNYRLYKGDLDINPLAVSDDAHPSNRIDLKSDYMESSMCTDPSLAVLFESMWDTPIPPKAIDGLSRATIWTEGAFALFHDNGTTVRFEGVYNLNGDKGDNKAWGFYEDLDTTFPNARRYEVLFNASDHAVAFVKDPLLTENEWLLQIAEGFEIRYPYDEDDVADWVAAGDFAALDNAYGPLKDFIEFISASDLTTPAGLLAFRTAFEERVEPEYFIKYIIAIFVFGLVDNFGKDFLLSTWSTDGGTYPKWFTALYDMDSGVGIDNQGFMTNSSGELIFDYNIEMEDEGVFAQASSKLWDGVVAAYPVDIASTYADLRGTVFTFDNIWEKMYTDQIATISKGMYNANAISKYIEIAGSTAWLWMLNGDRVNQMKRWITNRLDYLDSKYDYNTDNKTITARLDIVDASAIEFQIAPSMHNWVTAQLGNTVSGYMKERAEIGEVVTLAPALTGGLPFVEFTIYSGDKIIDLTNFKSLPIRTLQLGDAEQLQILDLSKAVSETVLDSISFGNNNELLEVDLSNNAGLVGLLDLSGALKLKKLDLRGTGITSVLLPEGGVLEELHLPATITTLRLIDQQYLTSENLTIEDITSIQTIRIENTPVDSLDILVNGTSLSAFRIMGLEFSTNEKQFLLDVANAVYSGGSYNFTGLDSVGAPQTDPVLYGEVKAYLATDYTPAEYAILSQAFPNLTVSIVVPPVDLTFTDMGTYYEVLAYTGTETDLTIPVGFNAALESASAVRSYDFDDWKDVLGIGESAFRLNTTIENVYAPQTLEYIGDFAFDGCTNLRPWTFYESLTTIGQYAFRGDQYFNVLYIPASVLVIGAGAFSSNEVADGDLIFTAHATTPVGWDAAWVDSSYTVTWDSELFLRTFAFDVDGGVYVAPQVGYVLTTLPTTTKTGSEDGGWEIDGVAVTLPYIPEITQPSTISVEVQWETWNYNIRFYADDDAGTEYLYDSTYNVDYNVAFGSGRFPLDAPDSTASGLFKGWKNSLGDTVETDYTETRDLSSNSWNLDIYAQYVVTAGLVFTYDVVNDYYDVTEWEPTDPSAVNGYYNIFVPNEWDDGTNGTKLVRHVTMYVANTSHLDKLGSLEIEENILTDRIYKTNTSSSTFYAMEYATSVVIPDGFISFGRNSFDSWFSLTSVTLPSALASLSYSMFTECTSLSTITLPSGLTTIEDRAFMECTSLTSVVIPSTLTSMGSLAFYTCTSLTSVIFEGVNVPSTFFSNTQFVGTSAIFSFTNSQNNITAINSGAGIIDFAETTILAYPSASGAFDFASIIPSTVTVISPYVFSESGITSVVIPNTIVTIGEGAFNRSVLLTNVTIGSSVTSIGNYAFDGKAYPINSTLASVIMLPTAPPTLAGTGVFDNLPAGGTIYVPVGTLTTYQTATNWAEYAADIEEVV